jgi:hypothetical protein
MNTISQTTISNIFYELRETFCLGNNNSKKQEEAKPRHKHQQLLRLQ